MAGKRRSSNMRSQQQNQSPHHQTGASLIAKRDSILARVKAIHENFETKINKDNFEQYRPAFDKLSDLQQRFDVIQEQVIELNSELEKNQRHDIEGPQVSLDSLVIEAQALFLKYVPKKDHKPPSDDASPASPLSSPSVPSTTASTRVPTVRLPRLELPHFNGNIANWRSFYNVFRVSVHESSANAIEKFHLLHNCLEGEAFDLVKGLDFTEENYKIAFDLLVKRYNSERRFILFHFNNLYDIQDVKHSSQVPSFLSKLRENTQALTALGHPISSYDPFLTTVVYRKLSPHFRRRLEDYRGTKTDFPKMSEMIKYLEKECLAADDPNLNTRDRKTLIASAYPGPSKAPKNGKSQPEAKSTANDQNKRACPLCKKPHPLIACPEYKAKNVSQRRELIISLKRCLNCIGSSHFVPTCMSKNFCKIPGCGKKHHTSLHQEKTENPAPPTAAPPSVPPDKVLIGTSSPLHSEVMLATAKVRITSDKGRSKVVRAVLDCASQSTILTTRVAKDLKLFIEYSADDVSGLSQYQVPIQGTSHISLTTCDRQKIARDHPISILDHITGQVPATLIHPDVRSHLKNWPLADETFDTPSSIDLLIGADLFSKVVIGKPFSLGPSMPYALETKMGFTLLGSAPSASNSSTVLVTSPVKSDSSQLHAAIQRFWELEEPKLQSIPPKEMDPAEKSFITTTERTSSGRFVVRLPFSKPTSKLGESSAQARRRFDALEAKFRAQPDFKEKYVKFIQDYQDAGFMVPAPPDIFEKIHYFLPHHGVLKKNSSTTKLRVVFDASAKTSTGYSLNDLLHVGSKLISDIRSVLFNFRRRIVTLSCDIKQMYNQTLLHKDDQPFHLVYWRSSEDQPLQVFMMTTVTFGVASSAFLAIRSLQQLALDHKDEFPRAAKAILEDVYVDDCISGEMSVEDALSLQNELIDLLRKGGYTLRKWTSNSKDLLQGVSLDDQETPIVWKDDQTSSFSILGLQWIPSEDQFTYYIQNLDRPATKRGVLSTLSTIFDPMGWVGPSVFLAKSFMQQLWLLKIDWDTPLPLSLVEKWDFYLKDLPALRLIRIPRLLCQPNSHVQVHGFADASDLGYGCVTYLRYESPDGKVSTSLLMAKSKVAPLQRVSIPRLELSATTLLASLLSYIVPLLRQNYSVEEIYAWSDSTVTLHWIQTPSYKLKTFVANRVAYIQETLPETKWGFVKGLENPADCLSRGLTASQLATHALWWQGPPWLLLPPSDWPNSRLSPPPKELPESRPVRTVLATQTAQSTPDNLFFKFSSFSKLQRILAYVLRFKHNALNPQHRHSGPLTSIEFQAAERVIVRKIQQDSFQDDLETLQNKSKTLEEKKYSARLRRLQPFLDEYGLIRVGGRLSHAPLSADRKHPWILPKNHALTKLLITHFHLTNLHAGPQLLQSLLFQRYWILSGRSAIRSAVFSCVRCFRVKPRNSNPLMGDLPAARVTPSRAFVLTAMDYAGPMKAKVHTLRFARVVQVYLCVFVCMSTKAVHLELAQDLTSEAFIAALTRFSGRRGVPSDLYSDNGKNFVGASNELKRIRKALLADLQENSQFTKFPQNTHIRFHFNPPAAPHQGGLFEAAVKSAKFHLARVLHGQVLTLEELNTLIIRVEAMLNSRPLTPISSDPSELTPLTPAHFLIGGSLSTPVERDHREQSLNSLKRWHRVQAMAQAVWKRWSLEYLHTLQSRAKWNEKGRNLKIDDLVLIHDPHSPPFQWNLGRITKVFPGKDGCVRVASVRTSTTELQRPAVKLYPLPISE